MNPKKNRNWFSSAMSMAIGLLCALVLGALFYGAMAYQLSGGGAADARAAAQADAGARLALADVQLTDERSEAARYGGTDCAVFVRSYALEGGQAAKAITATPAAYMERLGEEGFSPQLITGFVLAGMDAVYAVHPDGRALLCSRAGDAIYMIEAPADEQAVYALGAGACLE